MYIRPRHMTSGRSDAELPYIKTQPPAIHRGWGLLLVLDLYHVSTSCFLQICAFWNPRCEVFLAFTVTLELILRSVFLQRYSASGLWRLSHTCEVVWNSRRLELLLLDRLRYYKFFLRMHPPKESCHPSTLDSLLSFWLYCTIITQFCQHLFRNII